MSPQKNISRWATIGKFGQESTIFIVATLLENMSFTTLTHLFVNSHSSVFRFPNASETVHSLSRPDTRKAPFGASHIGATS